MKLISWFKILCGMLLVFFYHHAYALYISADISSMESGEPFFSKPYINDTKKTNLYTFSAYQLIGRVIKSRAHLFRMEKFFLLPLKKFYYPGSRNFLKFSIEERRMKKNVIIKLLLVKRHLI